MDGLGAFIDGAMRGYDYGDRVKHRKKTRQLDDEDREWLRENRAQQRKEWDRRDKEMDRIDAERDMFKDVAEDARQSYNEGRSVKVSTRNAPEGGEDNAADPTESRLPRHAALQNPERVAGQPAHDGAPRQPDAPTSEPSPNPQVARDVQPDRTRPDLGAGAPPDAAATMGAWEDTFEAMARRQDMNPVMVRRARLADAAAHEILTGKDAVTGEKLGDDQVQQRRAAIANIEQQFARVGGSDSPVSRSVIPDQAANEAAMRRGGFVRPESAPPTTPEAPVPNMRAPSPLGRVLPDRAPKAPDDLPMNRERLSRPPSKVATEPEAAAARDAVASAPPDEGGAPSLAVAEATAPKPTERGVKKPGSKGAKAAANKAAGSFLDHYAKEAVPKIVEYYLTKGDIEKAEAFQSWATARETKGQLESWAKAVHAATIGDDEGFADHIADAYNSFDDGLEVVRDQSDFVRDESGAITGGVITYRNTKTGETFVQTYEDQEDILRAAVFALSPEQVFERLWSEVAAANEAKADQQAFERKIILEQIKSGMKAPAQDAKDIAFAKKDLQEAMLPGEWAKLTPEEQTRRAVEYVRENRKAGQQLGLPDKPAPYTGG